MFRKHKLGYVTDDEFDNIICPFDDCIREYVLNNVLNQYIAFYIAEGYRKSAVWENDMDIIVATAIEMLCQYNKKDCDYSKIKELLKTEYDLEVINEEPVQVKDLRT